MNKIIRLLNIEKEKEYYYFEFQGNNNLGKIKEILINNNSVKLDSIIQRNNCDIVSIKEYELNKVIFNISHNNKMTNELHLKGILDFEGKEYEFNFMYDSKKELLINDYYYIKANEIKQAIIINNTPKVEVVASEYYFDKTVFNLNISVFFEKEFATIENNKVFFENFGVKEFLEIKDQKIEEGNLKIKASINFAKLRKIELDSQLSLYFTNNEIIAQVKVIISNNNIYLDAKSTLIIDNKIVLVTVQHNKFNNQLTVNSRLSELFNVEKTKCIGDTLEILINSSANIMNNELVFVESENKKNIRIRYFVNKIDKDKYIFRLSLKTLEELEKSNYYLALINNDNGNLVLIKSKYEDANNIFKYRALTLKNKNYAQVTYNTNNHLVLTIREKEIIKEKVQSDKELHNYYKNVKLGKKIRRAFLLFYCYLVYIISLIYKNMFVRRKQIWLIGETNVTAQDNGYHFFKYVRKNYPEKDCYYLIDKNSPDIDNIKEFGNIIYLKSFKHILYLFLAKKHIGTHDYRHWMYPGNENIFQKYFENKIKGDFIQLQHGIIHVRSERGFHYTNNKKYDMIIATCEYEKELLIDFFKHNEKNVKITGLARFDNLIDTSINNDKKVIAILPTWRKGIRNQKKFLQSDYYTHWISLLSDIKLIEYLRENNCILKFYLHIKLQPFTDNFKSLENDVIKVLHHGEENVQDVLKTSNLLITDYSSVSLDFAYMRKPVIFYQFDYIDYIKSYNLMDYEEYEEFRFGEICREKNSLISKIIFHVNSNFEFEKIYDKKREMYFKFNDYDNCKRIYNAITEMN